MGEGSCYFKDGVDSKPVKHGYLLDEDGKLGEGDFTFDLSRRKVVQCKSSSKEAVWGPRG